MALDWRKATPDELLARLDEIDLETFEEAVENESFNEDHVRLLLKNPGLDGALVERISREARFFKRGLLRFALVSHPRLPRVRALEMVPYLFWRDALRVATSLKVHPHVRVVAEQHVAARVSDLTLGERVTLARTATRTVLQALREDKDPRVIAAVLQNYRCTEEDVLLVTSSQSTPPQVLAQVARNPKWRARPALRSSLVRNPRLGLPLALGFLEHLTPGELKTLIRQKDLPKLLQKSARRLLEETKSSPGGAGRVG